MAGQTARAAGLLVEALVREGVKYVFSVSGSSILPIFDAALDAPLEIIHARQEWGASFMAEGWGRATGEPGVCLVTLGPGVANCTNAAMTALLDSVPLVILGGRAPTRVWNRDGFGDIDTAALMRPVTKFAWTISDPRRVAEYIHLAFQHARSGRPGPVYLEVPNDVLNQEVGAEEASRTGPRPIERPAPAPAAIEAAAELLGAAARPLLIAGSGARLAGAGDAVVRFAERFGVPVFGARLGRGLIPRDHPLHLGIAIIGTNPVLRRALKEADVLVLLGARLEFDLEFGADAFFPPGLKLVQVDIDPTWIGRNRPADVAVVGDARLALDQLSARLDRAGGSAMAGRSRSWTDSLAQQRREFLAQRETLGRDSAHPVHPGRLCLELNRALQPGAIVAISGGEIWSWGRNLIEVSPPGCILEPHRSGTLGAEIPQAIGAKLARPQAQVVALTGDGGFGYSGIELGTAARYNIPITCVVANDGVWAMEKWSQVYAFGEQRVYATTMLGGRYDRFAQSLDAYGEHVEDAAELPEALRRALESGRAACVEVMTRDLPGPDTRWWFIESGQGSPG